MMYEFKYESDGFPSHEMIAMPFLGGFVTLSRAERLWEDECSFISVSCYLSYVAENSSQDLLARSDLD
jgi:hypothetical protein